MEDGSRWFAELPPVRTWGGLRAHLEALPGLIVTGLMTDGVTEAWLDFSYAGQGFTVHDPQGDYWFFAEDAACEETVLMTLLEHLRVLEV